MKFYSIFLFISLIMLTADSYCQQGSTKEHLELIADSEEYHQFELTRRTIMLAIQESKWDPQLVMTELNQSKYADSSSCEIPLSEFSHIDRIDIHLSLSCDRSEQLKALHSIYGYRYLTLEEMKEVRALFYAARDTNHKVELFQAEIQENLGN